MNCKICLENDAEQIITFNTINQKQFYLCEDCYKTLFNNIICCAQCNKIIANINLNKKENIFIDAICRSNFIYCVDCGERILENKFCYIPDNYKGYCYKPNPQFYKMNNYEDVKENIFLGVELEIGGLRSDNIVRKFCNEHGGNMFYFKSDGSIRGAGCEIVTHPATLVYHKSSDSGWKELFDDFNELGFRSGVATNTGLHIHVNRNALSPNEWKKIDLLVNGLRDFFEMCARRRETHYCEYHRKRHSLWGESNSRYEAVNFSNIHTVEFRIFSGTNNVEELFATLELVQSIVFLSKRLTYDDLYENTSAIKKNLKDIIESNNFNYLITYLNKLNNKWWE